MKSKFFYIALLHFLNDGFSASLLLFLPFIAHDLGLNLTKVGILGTGLNLLPVALSLPSVFFANKLGSFKVLLLALFLYGVGYLALSGSVGFLSVLVIFLATGVGFGLFHPIAFSLVSHWSEKGNIGRQMGNFTAWGDVGRLALSSGVTFLIVAFSWRRTALMYGLVSMLFFIYLYYFHFRKNFLPLDEKLESRELGFKHLLVNPQFIFAILCCAFDNLASSPLFIFLPFLLLSKHIEPTFLSSFAGAFLVGNLLGKAVLGRWVDELGSAKVFIVTELIMAGLILAMTVVNAFWLIATIAIILGIATRGTVPATRSMVYKSVVGSKNFQRANAVTEFGNMLAAAAAPVVLGIISDRFGIAGAFYALAIFAILATIPAFIFLTLRRRQPIAA